MRRNIKNTLTNRMLVVLLSSLTWTAAQAAKPLWTIVPAPGSNPTQTVPENETANVQYVVQNQSKKPKNLVIQPIPGITQITACQLAPKGQPGSSCTLNLAITGSKLPEDGVHGGPELCQANPDGSQNPNQCYQPSKANVLNITKGGRTTPSVSQDLCNRTGLLIRTAHHLLLHRRLNWKLQITVRPFMLITLP